MIFSQFEQLYCKIWGSASEVTTLRRYTNLFIIIIIIIIINHAQICGFTGRMLICVFADMC